MRYEELTIEGRNAVLEAFRSGRTIDKLFVLDGCQDGPVRTILREARKYDTIINYVPRERLDQISETGKHQGVIAYAAAYEYAEVEDMLKADLANKGRMNIYRIVIQGTRAPELLLLPERLKSFGYVTEVLDESKPSYDLEALQKKYSGTLIGDYISYFLEKDRNAVEEKALYYGLQALLETSR